MTDNPYAPSQATLAESSATTNTKPLILSGGEIFSNSFRIMGDNFLALSGLALLWLFVIFSAVSSLFGMVALPHLVAGPTFAGYRYYKKQGGIDRLFDGFQEFGSLFGYGILTFVFYHIIFFVFFVAMAFSVGFASAALRVDADHVFEARPAMAFGGLGVGALLFAYFLHYIAARLILVHPLIVYFKHDISQAISVSWKATSANGHTITLQHILFQSVVPSLGMIFFCIGVLPAVGLTIAFHGAVCGPLLDHLFPDGVPPTNRGATSQRPTEHVSSQSVSHPAERLLGSSSTAQQDMHETDDDRFKPPSFPSGSSGPSNPSGTSGPSGPSSDPRNPYS